MHKYGKVLLPTADEAVERAVFGLVRATLSAEDVSRVTRVHAFVVRYAAAGPGAGQRSLASHIDDSTFTINLCLASVDAEGADLVFDAPGGDGGRASVVRHAACRGLVHSGALRHHVTELLAGERENLIVWVTCSTRATLCLLPQRAPAIRLAIG